MIIPLPFAPLPSCITITCSKPFSQNNHFIKSSIPRFILLRNAKTSALLCTATNGRSENSNSLDFDIDITEEDQVIENDDYGGFSPRGMETKDIFDGHEGQGDDGDDRRYSGGGPYRGAEEKDFDRNPEFAEILGGFLDDPQKAQSRVSNTMY
jgi:hypothetical protein